MLRIDRLFCFGVFVCFLMLAPEVSFGQVKLGAIGDSLLDEHSDQTDPFGNSLGYSANALELLVDAGKIDLGATGNWGGTRRDGYEYNWALAGATTSSLLADGQHTNLAAQIPGAGITKAVIVVGANDLFPFPPGNGSSYETVYNGAATPAEISAISSQAVGNVVAAAQTLKATGVDLVVPTAPDYGIAPFTKSFYTDPIRRELVDDVIETWNADAVARLTSEVQVPVVDMYTLTKDIWGDHGSENNTFELGGVMLNLNGTGGVNFANVLNNTFTPANATSDTVDAFVHDGIHPNNAIGGLFANLFMTAFNEEYGDSFSLFTEQEILQNAGPNLGALYSSDTVSNSLGGNTYSNYVISSVPEPNAACLLIGTGIVTLLRRRRM